MICDHEWFEGRCIHCEIKPDWAVSFRQMRARIEALEDCLRTVRNDVDRDGFENTARLIDSALSAGVSTLSASIKLAESQCSEFKRKTECALGLLRPLGNQVTPSVMAIREAIRILER